MGLFVVCGVHYGTDGIYVGEQQEVGGRVPHMGAKITVTAL